MSWLGSATNGLTDLFAGAGHFSNELCVGSTCVTEAQFSAMASAAAAATLPVSVTSSGSGQVTNSGGQSGTSSAPVYVTSSSTPPVIAINGANPTTIQVGDNYQDLGATINGPTADLNLGIQLYIDSTPVDAVQLNTTEAGTHSIDYVATGHSGLTSTTTRTVIVAAPHPVNDNPHPQVAEQSPHDGTTATSTPVAANDNTRLIPLSATGTAPTSTDR